jgi:hypothetical protein
MLYVQDKEENEKTKEKKGKSTLVILKWSFKKW